MLMPQAQRRRSATLQELPAAVLGDLILKMVAAPDRHASGPDNLSPVSHAFLFTYLMYRLEKHSSV